MVQRTRLQILYAARHPRSLQLEDGARLAATEHGVGLCIVQWQFVQVQVDATHSLDVRDRLGQHRQVRQPEEVHLQQADLVQDLHVVLGHGAVAAGGALEWHVVRQRLIRHHHAGGVRPRVARHTLEAARRIDQPRDVRLTLIQRLELRALLQRVAELQPDGNRGYELGDAVYLVEWIIQRATHVANRRAREQASKGDDLRHPVSAVAIDHVLDHFVTAVVGEVHVNVRHLDALWVEEALKRQPVLDRVQVRNAQAVQDDAAGCRAARTARNAASTCPIDEVPDEQNVGGETGLLDHLQLVGEPAALLLRYPLAVPSQQALLTRALEEFLRRLSGWNEVIERWKAESPEFQIELAPLGDADRIAQRLRQVTEQLPHLCRCLQAERPERLHAHPLGILVGAVGLHAEQHVMSAGLIRAGVVAVVGHHQRNAELLVQLEQTGVDRLVVRTSVVLEFQEIVFAEHLAIPGCRVACPLKIGLQNGSRRLATVAGAQRDQAARVFGQQRAIDARLVVVPLQAGARDQLDQVVVALEVLRQQHQVEVVAVLVAQFVGHPARADVGLDAEDRFDAGASGM